jgi:putative membrane protein
VGARRVVTSDPTDAGESRSAARAAPDSTGDATRRTRLANERTYLAWWRTALAAFAVSLGAGKIAPALTKQATWPYTVVGLGFALLGMALVGYGFRRKREVDAAIARGAYVEPDDRVVAALTSLGVVLGVALIAIVAWTG